MEREREKEQYRTWIVVVKQKSYQVFWKKTISFNKRELKWKHIVFLYVLNKGCKKVFVQEKKMSYGFKLNLFLTSLKPLPPSRQQI